MRPLPQAQPAPAPAPPAPVPEPTIVFPGQAGGGTGILVQPAPEAPLTARAVEAIRARRKELSSQLISAADRREELVEALRGAPSGPARTGIEERIRLLDARILQLEADIAETGAQLTSAAAGTVAVGPPPEQPFALSAGQITAISIVFILAVLGPLTFALARRVWPRGGVEASDGPALERIAERMSRLEQALETVAIEVERVSEGQRFVSRLLSERGSPALGAGEQPAEPVRIRAKGEPVPRGGG